ncbi:MAG: Unknown protein [uncultured Sulfurovum sp.]|uniref:N-acyl amino acid synthase FeeM catalytic core domain-containing protein n=1 Tax=uncultured Sulfurovum sp. TaxID=269237 RepID=A0A6S6T3C4_9BACT|nr:MAG: Unknown protein [uncultured Sulfurovum sp.]
MTYPYLNNTHEKIETLLMKYKIDATPDQKNNLTFIMEKTLAFNNSLNWDQSIGEVFLPKTVDELFEIYMLRSQVYGKLNYDKEFPDSIQGLNFDLYDTCSAILYTKANAKMTGTCRVIFDSDTKLPMDKNFSLDYMREENKHLVELSRLMIERECKGLGQEPKLLTKGTYEVMKKNGKTTMVSVMVHEHFKLYDKFGGFSIESELKTYGTLSIPFIITSWEIDQISPFFKKVFLAV